MLENRKEGEAECTLPQVLVLVSTVSDYEPYDLLNPVSVAVENMSDGRK